MIDDCAGSLPVEALARAARACFAACESTDLKDDTACADLIVLGTLLETVCRLRILCQYIQPADRTKAENVIAEVEGKIRQENP